MMTPRTRILRPLAAGVLALAAASLAAPADAMVVECSATDTRLSRTFTPPSPRPAGAVPVDAFEMTRGDFLNVYAHGLEVEVGRSPRGEIYPMDVGFTDDAMSGPASWSAPEIPFEAVTWRIVDPAATPHAARFSTSTHALVTSADPEFAGTRYRYYSFQEAQLVLDATLDVPSGEGASVEEPFNFTVSLFPLNTLTEFYESGTYYYEDDDEVDPTQPFHAEALAGFHGYGTLTLPDGSTAEVGSFYNDFDIYELAGHEDTFDFETLYSFNGRDGTWFSFRIANPPGWDPDDYVDVQGDVWIDEVEYWRVVGASVATGERPAEAAPWTVFPNPTADVVRFSQPLTATIYDMMGRPVQEARQAREVDLRGVASGTYVVRSEAGHTRRVTVRR